MIGRRGFLRGLLGLALAPTAAALAPIANFIQPSNGFVHWKVYTKAAVLNEAWLANMEIGRVESFRFIESRNLSNI